MHALINVVGRPFALMLTPGNMTDVTAASELLARMAEPNTWSRTRRRSCSRALDGRLRGKWSDKVSEKATGHGKNPLLVRVTSASSTFKLENVTLLYLQCV
jgi:hypothetical protein